MKYPDECPVFELDGEHYEVMPSFSVHGFLWAVDCNGHASRLIRAMDHRAKPLTDAARELVEWAKP